MHTPIRVAVLTVLILAWQGVAAGWMGSTTASAASEVVRVSPTGDVLVAWASDAADADDADGVGAECRWWDGTHQYDLGGCGPFAVTRLNGLTASRALERARACAAAAETDCVLGAEIGFDVPAAFVYDAEEGFKMIVAPRVLRAADDAEVSVRLQNPTGDFGGRVLQFNHTIDVEYLRGGSRLMETTTFRDTEAFCVQALRAAVHADCWAQLD